MKNTLTICKTSLFIACMLACTPIVTAAEIIQMRPIPITPVEPAILGGTKLDRKDWPATLYFNAPDGLFCTATVIGPRVVLTAAHCIADGASALITFADAQTATVTCEHQPGYDRPSLKADLALCHSDDDLAVSTFEILTFDAPPAIGEMVFLIGFGCTSIAMSPTSPKPPAFGGLSRVSSYAGLPWHVTTKLGDGSVMLCPGDSGGAAYRLLDTAKPNGARAIFGVNSGYWPTRAESLVVPLAAYEMRSFVRDWSARNSVLICGLHEETSGCRN